MSVCPQHSESTGQRQPDRGVVVTASLTAGSPDTDFWQNNACFVRFPPSLIEGQGFRARAPRSSNQLDPAIKNTTDSRSHPKYADSLFGGAGPEVRICDGVVLTFVWKPDSVSWRLWYLCSCTFMFAQRGLSTAIKKKKCLFQRYFIKVDFENSLARKVTASGLPHYKGNTVVFSELRDQGLKRQTSPQTTHTTLALAAEFGRWCLQCSDRELHLGLDVARYLRAPGLGWLALLFR